MQLKGLAKKVPGLRKAVITLRDGARKAPPHKAPPGWDGPTGKVAEAFHRERMEWRDLGPTPGLVDRARSFADAPRTWKRLDPRLALVYGGVLVENSDIDAAGRLIEEFASRQDVAALARVLPLARIARDLGVVSPEVDRAAETADLLLARATSDRLRALTAGRSVAVVGNGDSPLGAGRGAEIDAHDVVIRFNNFPAGFEADLGTRTDVWVRGAHRDVADRYAIEDFGLVLWEMDLFRNLLEHPTHASILHRDTQFAPEKIGFFDTETKQSLRQASNLRLPSSGAQLLWALKRARGTLRGVTTYGFSTIEGEGTHSHFFDSLGDLGSRHDVTGEGEFLRGLLDADRRTDEPTPLPAVAADSVSALPPRHLDTPDGPLTIVSSAFREYDPANGKTGGPAGVLATQHRALGDEFRGHSLEYLFRDKSAQKLRRRLTVDTAGLSTKTAEIIVGAEYLRAADGVVTARAAGRRLAFVCHELGSAYGAYLLGAPYVIVYHGQGSTMRELRSIGQVPEPHEIAVATHLEQLICENASSIWFPSLGARDTFLATSNVDPAKLNLAETALYNTVSAADHDAPAHDGQTVAAMRRAMGLPPKSDDTDVFVTVGDYNHDKGIDRIPALLNRYVEMTGRKALWIAVGRAADPEIFNRLKSESADWQFDAHLVGERMDHDALLALFAYGDFYLMLHRAAIFDLATLEAMRAGLPLILSRVGGNREVAVGDNVVFVDEGALDEACREIARRDRVAWGDSNRAAFNDEFSLEHFGDRYASMLQSLVDEALSTSD